MVLIVNLPLPPLAILIGSFALFCWVSQEAGRRVADVVSSDKYTSSGAYWRWNGQTAEATARENVVSDEAMDEARCEKLWQISSDLVGI